MGVRIATGIGLIFAMAIGTLYVAQLNTLQDTGESLTTGPLQDYWTTVTPIAIIVIAGFISVGTCYAIFKMVFGR